MAGIFLSHSKRDAKWSRCLKEQLEAAGLEVFFDENVRDGDDWSPQIQDALATATHFFLVVSPESMASRWVSKEFHSFHARKLNELGLEIVPVMRAAAPLPLFLSQLQHAREVLTSDTYGTWLEKVVEEQFSGSIAAALPSPLANPHWDDEIRRIPEPLYDRVLDAIEGVLQSTAGTYTFKGVMGFEEGKYDAIFSEQTRCQANYGFVQFVGERPDRFEGAIELLEKLVDRYFKDDPIACSKLRTLIDDLESAKAAATPAPERLVAYRASFKNWRPDLLRERLRLDVRDAENERRDQRELDEVYVELAVEGVKGRSLLVSGDPKNRGLTLESLLAFDPASTPGITGHYVLRGHPGTGKSTALRSTARRFAADPKALIPVYLPLPEFSRSAAAWNDFVCHRHPGAGVEELREALAPKHEGKGLAILCDGLDEVVGGDRRTAVFDMLRSLSITHRQARIVVATRRIGYEPFAPNQFVDVDLVALDPPRQKALLENWFKSGKRVKASAIEKLVNRVLADLQRGGPMLRELREVPLLLTFVAMLYEDQHDVPSFSVSGSRAKLLCEVLGHLIAGKHRVPRRDPIQPERETREVLRRLAMFATEFEAHHGEGNAPTRADYESELGRIWDEPELKAVRVRWKDDRDRRDILGYLAEVRDVTGILGGDDDSAATWGFPHRSLREALTAEYLQGDPARVTSLLDQIRGNEAQWAEPLALWVSAAKDPDQELLRIRTQNVRLAVRALASVASIQPETVLEVLDLKNLEPDDRDHSILELSYKIEDPEPLCRVLGQLAASTDDTGVLWHIDEALRGVLAADPGAAEFVAHAEQRLFERANFGREFDPRWLVVPGHPENPYWVRVDAGTTFTMGSPESELDREDEEGPQHLVTFVRGYEIAAVPITREIWGRFRLDATAGDESNLPIVGIDWYDATMFCRWATLVGAPPFELRLPSEAEWECACRAGTTTAYSFGDKASRLGEFGWYKANSDGPRPVATKPGNRWKFFDGHGNVENWCAERFHVDYESAPSDGSPWTEGGLSGRVLRGGSWRAYADTCRSSFRYAGLQHLRSNKLGFRPARFVTDPLHSFTPPRSQEPSRADTVS